MRSTQRRYSFARFFFCRLKISALNPEWAVVHAVVQASDSVVNSFPNHPELHELSNYTVVQFMYRLQHCLEWVMRVYKSKFTPDSVVNYLFHDYDCWAYCGACVRWSTKYSTHSTVCSSDGVLPCSACVCTVWEINRVLLRISNCFCATLLDFTSRIERLHFVTTA